MRVQAAADVSADMLVVWPDMRRDQAQAIDQDIGLLGLWTGSSHLDGASRLQPAELDHAWELAYRVAVRRQLQRIRANTLS